MVDDFIPLKKLHEGFTKCQDHVSLLLEGSKLLYDYKKYSLSMPLSILALEECAKLSLFSKKVYGGKGISHEEWKSLTKGGSHSTKLTKPLKDSRDELSEKGEQAYEIVASRQKNIGSIINFPPLDKMLSAYEKEENLIENLNKIKKLCLYVDWKEGNWESFLSNFTTHQKKVFSSFLLTYVNFVFNNELLGMKYPHFPYDKDSSEFKKFINDPLWQTAQKYEKLVNTNEFRKNQLIASSLLQKIQKN